MKKLLLGLFILAQVSVLAQSGKVKGTVTQGDAKEPVWNALVYAVVNGGRKYVQTDFDGLYTLELPAGKYMLHAETLQDKDSILIDIIAGQEIQQNFNIGSSAQELGGHTVVAKKDNTSSVADIADEKNEETTTESLGKEEMVNKDVSNAGDAVKQTPGATVEGGKYVYVRGLSDRYSKTLFNGADIPGLDPNRNSVQMDLFPSSLLEKVKVYKTFSPDLPGSFTGGLVDIITRDFPSDFTVNYSVKLGFNTQASLNKSFLTQDRKGLDFLGFGAANRQIPANIANLSVENWPSFASESSTLNEFGKSFERQFDPIRRQSGINQSHTFTVGNSIKLNKDDQYPKLGYFVGLSYKRNFDYYQGGAQGRYKLTGDVTDAGLNPELNLEDSRGQENVIWGALGNVSLKLNDKHKLGLTVNRFQNGINSARYLEGHNYSDANDLFFQTRTLYYQQRALTNGQLKGEHYITNADKFEKDQVLKLNWIASYTSSMQETPELKFFTNDYTISGTDTIYDLQPALYSDPSQFYRLMLETNLNTRVDLEIPFAAVFDTKEENKNKFQVGAYFLNKDRIFNEKRYDFVQQSGADMAYNGSVNDYMADENFDAPNFSSGFLYLDNASEKRNNYVGTETNISAYAMSDLHFGDLDVRVGARVEKDIINSRSLNPDEAPGNLDNLDVLPSVNATYHIFQQDSGKFSSMQVRGGYSRTLARPTFRELAPFSSFDFVGGNVFVGNPDLQRTITDNLDLRLEYYPTITESMSLGLFAKNFTNPIERAFNPEASNAEVTWKNVDNAKVYGAEFEVRKEVTKNLVAGGNVTYVKSIVTIPTKEYQVILDQDPNAPNTREMFGQSPYIVNAFLTYKNDSSNLVANLNFGVSGKQISVVTIGATPNVYQQARPNLGFNVSKKFGEDNQFTAKFSATNLLNAANLHTYNYNNQDYIFSRYTTGRTFSIKLAYNFVNSK